MNCSVSVHIPPRRASAPLSTAAPTSSRANRALPSVRVHRKWRTWPSTGPPSASRTSRSRTGRPSGSRSSRSHSPSFHSPTTASGTSSPRRTVASTRRPSWVASWCTSAAEASSSVWASSMASTAGSRARMASAPGQGGRRVVDGQQRGEGAERNDAGRPGRAHPQDAQAASSARSTASASRRDLPTPASPASTTPRRAARASAALELPLAPDEGPSGLQPATSSPRRHAT